jgi:hypothetical protein
MTQKTGEFAVCHGSVYRSVLLKSLVTLPQPILL